MNTIAEVKKEVRHREWVEQIRECQSSGLSIKEWCRQNRGNVYTYYRKLRKLREELLESKDTDTPQIVPISVSWENSGAALIGQMPGSAPDPTPDSKVVMRKNEIEIELPESISEKTLVYAVARTAPARTTDRTLPHFEPHFAGH